ncbi:MAG: hypothetical protein KAX19_05145 [Candidatus Brocadiae bacterium]|nr:hypothetical protein [Candidatus Brocadiia bacterium]
MTEFKVRDESGKDVPISQARLSATAMCNTDCPREEWEYVVGVDWIETVPLQEAIKEKGFFGNQNTVAKPRAKEWVHTVERLKEPFDVEE